jgi:hypothetical protein
VEERMPSQVIEKTKEFFFVSILDNFETSQLLDITVKSKIKGIRKLYVNRKTSQ